MTLSLSLCWQPYATVDSQRSKLLLLKPLLIFALESLNILYVPVGRSRSLRITFKRGELYNDSSAPLGKCLCLNSTDKIEGDVMLSLSQYTRTDHVFHFLNKQHDWAFFLKQYPWRITQTKCCEGSCLKSVVGNDPDHILLWILTRHQWLWAEPHWGSEFIRKHFSWGMVCFPTEEELRCVKFFFFVVWFMGL